jgi:hypothetical protein
MVGLAALGATVPTVELVSFEDCGVERFPLRGEVVRVNALAGLSLLPRRHSGAPMLTIFMPGFGNSINHPTPCWSV